MENRGASNDKLADRIRLNLEREKRAKAAEERLSTTAPKMVSPVTHKSAPDAPEKAVKPVPRYEPTIPTSTVQKQQQQQQQQNQKPKTRVPTTQAPWEIIRVHSGHDWYDVGVDFPSQFKDEDLEVACTAFGIAVSWYFLRRAQPSHGDDRRRNLWEDQGKEYYQIRYDTLEIHDIYWMTQNIYQALLKPTSRDRYISAPETLSLQKYPDIARNSAHYNTWMSTYADCPLGTMPITFMICPTQFRVAQSRRYYIELAGESLVVHTQDHMDEPELSERKKKEKAWEYVRARAEFEIKKIGDEEERQQEKRALLNTYLGNLNVLIQRHNSLLQHGSQLDETLPHSDVDAIYNDLVNEWTQISTAIYKPLIATWQKLNPPPRKDAQRTRVVDQKERARITTENAVTIAACRIRDGLMELPSVTMKILTDPFHETVIEGNRRIALPNMPSIVEVAAQVYYSPYMYNSLKGTNYPFSLVLSQGDSATFSIFRDSEPSAPWILFDSHGGGGGGVDELAIVREYHTIESLGTFSRLQPDRRGNSSITFQLLMREEDRDAVVKAIIKGCHDTFQGLEPFRPPTELDQELFKKVTLASLGVTSDAHVDDKPLLGDDELSV